MPETTQQLEPAIITIFGITGDLSQRYLLPALYHLFQQKLLHPQTEIVGISRRDVSLDAVFEQLEKSLGETETGDQAALTAMRGHTRMVQMDLDDGAAYSELLKTLNGIEETVGVCMNRLYYLSIPPQAYASVIGLMGKERLNGSCQHGRAASRLLVEKPFGYDLPSAEQLIAETIKVFTEDQLFRIDHFLAKETVQNLLTFRFKNPIFESLWNREHIARIEIGASEKIGIEGRAAFYEPLGALRDFVQNHLLQLLTFVTMNQPEALTSQPIHAAKQAVFEQIQPVPADQVHARAVRGQYAGYREEVNNANSMTETYAGITVFIDSDRWQGVPVSLWTGKNLVDKKYQITVDFRREGDEPGNRLRFLLQPNEGIELDVLAKRPGLEDELQTVAMGFSYEQQFETREQPNAYERVLVDAVKGDHTLFTTGEEILASWRIVQPVLDAWSKQAEDLITYQPGTTGPLGGQ